MKQKLASRQLEPFGVEISGIDLSKDLPEEVTDELRRLYDRHHLLVFREQKLTLEEQRRAAAIFGPIFPLDEGVHFISNTRKEGFLGNLELKFHSDLAHCEYPIEGVMLQGIELDSGRTSTKFSSSIRAWDSLPEDLKDRVLNRRALHVFAYGPNDGKYWVDRRLPHWSHRIARPHPRTGELCLYVMPESTRMIEGMNEDEAMPILERLYAHVARPEAIYEHVWHVGDVVLWDNLANQHARGALDPNVPRTMQRATLGLLTFKQQYPDLGDEVLDVITGRLGTEPQ